MPDESPPPAPTLRELAERATPGPWVHAAPGEVAIVWAGSIIVADCGNKGVSKSDADADFIAAANPAAVLALYAELDQLRAALREAQRAVAKCHAFAVAGRGSIGDSDCICDHCEAFRALPPVSP